MGPVWTAIGQVQPGDRIGYCGAIPSLKGQTPTSWRTIAGVDRGGRLWTVRFEDGTELDAGHRYRLWVSR